MRKFSDLFEAPQTIVFAFGRFNPPTTGHEKLIEKVKKIAGGDDYYIFPSHSQNNKKDPLPLAKKVAYMRDMFPKHKRNIIANNKLKTVLDIAVYFHEQGYVELNMVVGSDRVAEFKKLLTTYNGQEKRHGFYDFDTIQIFSAGERDPDAEGVTGMSASKMRAAATNNDYDTFQKGLPRGFKNGNQLFKDVRKGMNLKENSKYSDEEIERDLYVRGAIYQIGDLVENINDGTSGEIIRRGTNYVQYTDGENVHKAFLHSIKEAKKITKTKQDPDIKDSPGTEPAKYYAKGVGDKKGMSVSTKKARDAHFTKGAKMDDDNPNAYKPAPGDKGKKTKPSQYTKKFKQMYGEVIERRIDPADVDTSATDDDIAAADKNIMMQLRKSVSLRGNFPVQFMDKKKVKVSSKIAQAVQSKYNSMKKPADKEKAMIKDPVVMELEVETDRQLLCEKILSSFNKQKNLTLTVGTAASGQREGRAGEGAQARRAAGNRAAASARGGVSTPVAAEAEEGALAGGEIENISLATYLCDFGDVVVGSTKRKSFRLTNIGRLPVTFNFDKKLLAQAGIAIEPDKAQKVMPHASALFSVVLATRKNAKCGRLRAVVPVDVKGGPRYNIEFIANLTIPELTI